MRHASCRRGFQWQRLLELGGCRSGRLESGMALKSGSEALGTGALSSEQPHKLKQFQINTRIANEKYLRSHPEVEMMLSEFIREVLLKRPGDIREFAAEHFSDPALPGRIERKMEA
ncbi:RIIa domain-containing protein 1-like [Polyodon spathula]|uniref:RIIa domain-containing protein 1-like n=1 Tax=Polyodon spathula TaxID=7913 RepID=UPI001B7F75E7|nr:RIIa domain-containing protein 1-like [Polyodon spathula]